MSKEVIRKPDPEPVGEIIEMDDYTCIPVFKNGTPDPGTKLYTHPAPIPEGWQLVPIEPTKKMIDAACQSGISVNGRPIWKHTIDKQAIWKWKTMLAAAPKQGE